MLRFRPFVPVILSFMITGVSAAAASAPDTAAAAHSGQNLIASIGMSIFAAMVLGYLAHLFRQPLLLAYIVAGVLIGPRIGFGLVSNEADIEVITEIGLILLLFMIGLEMDMKKLRDAGRSLFAAGISQFLLCALLGLGFFALIGYTFAGGHHDLVYLAVCCALSSTTIVVKILYEKFELGTLSGRLTLGILVFQDLWAIVLLGIQPNLANPQVLPILASFAKGGMLVAVSFLISRYILGHMFKSISKLPEMMLLASLAWCFFVCSIAAYFGLSVEMGALIAGIAISTFPYNLDIIAKIVSIRDFFVTLFFVALGMKIPDPMQSPRILAIAGLAAGFLILSRFISVFPVLFKLKNGLRVSLLVPINLSQMSEFSLVIAALGLSLGHISQDTLSVVIFVFVITSVLSTYLMKFSHPLQGLLATGLQRLGIRDQAGVMELAETPNRKDIALLGFYRTASSFIAELEKDPAVATLKNDIMVIDFNPTVHGPLQALGYHTIYGDIGHLDTLHHAGIHDAKVVVSTVPDHLLKGTDNLQIVSHIKKLCPHARIIVTAETPAAAQAMYAGGADYVMLPRLLEARHLISVVEAALNEDLDKLRDADRARLEDRTELVN